MAEAMDMERIRRELLEAIEDDPTLIKSESTFPKQEETSAKNIEEEYDMLEEELRDGPIFEHEYDMLEEWEAIKAPPLEEVLAKISKMMPRRHR